jgi:hypothetical protein
MVERIDPSDDPSEPRDSGGFRENPAPQGLKEPPVTPPGEDSGEWTRGGGTDPNEIREEKRRESGFPDRDEPDTA